MHLQLIMSTRLLSSTPTMQPSTQWRLAPISGSADRMLRLPWCQNCVRIEDPLQIVELMFRVTATAIHMLDVDCCCDVPYTQTSKKNRRRLPQSPPMPIECYIFDANHTRSPRPSTPQSPPVPIECSVFLNSMSERSGYEQLFWKIVQSWIIILNVREWRSPPGRRIQV